MGSNENARAALAAMIADAAARMRSARSVRVFSVGVGAPPGEAEERALQCWCRGVGRSHDWDKASGCPDERVFLADASPTGQPGEAVGEPCGKCGGTGRYAGHSPGGPPFGYVQYECECVAAPASPTGEAGEIATWGEAMIGHPLWLTVRKWVEQGRSNEWIAHQLDVPAPGEAGDGLPDHLNWPLELVDDYLASHGCERAPAGTSAALSALTIECPECHGQGFHQDDSHPGNPTYTCDHCKGHRVVVAAGEAREGERAEAMQAAIDSALAEVGEQHWSLLGQIEAAISMLQHDHERGLGMLQIYVDGGWSEARAYGLGKVHCAEERLALCQARGYQVATILAESDGDPDLMREIQDNPFEWRKRRQRLRDAEADDGGGPDDYFAPKED